MLRYSVFVTQSVSIRKERSFSGREVSNDLKQRAAMLAAP